MPDLELYAMMAAAAYDDQRYDQFGDSDAHVGALEPIIASNNWSKLTGPDSGDGASYTSASSGMQADVWQSTDGSEIVIAFRGTESSRGISVDDYRKADGMKDRSTLSDWATLPKSIAEWFIADDDLSVSIIDQALDAINLVLQIRAQSPDAQITLTGHSLGGALAAFVSIYFGVNLGVDLAATLIDPAPFGNEYLMMMAAA